MKRGGAVVVVLDVGVVAEDGARKADGAPAGSADCPRDPSAFEDAEPQLESTVAEIVDNEITHRRADLRIIAAPRFVKNLQCYMTHVNCLV